MDSIDISDLAFSLGNFSAVNEMLSSTTEKISESIPESIPELVPNFVPENIPEFVTETIPEFVTESIPEFVTESVDNISDVDNNFFVYLGIGLVFIAILGIFAYNYFINKNKHVRFQDNVENYEQPPPNYEHQSRQYSDF